MANGFWLARMMEDVFALNQTNWHFILKWPYQKNQLQVLPIQHLKGRLLKKIQVNLIELKITNWNHNCLDENFIQK